MHTIALSFLKHSDVLNSNLLCFGSCFSSRYGQSFTCHLQSGASSLWFTFKWTDDQYKIVLSWTLLVASFKKGQSHIGTLIQRLNFLCWQVTIQILNVEVPNSICDPIPTPILIILREITLSKIGGHMAIFGGHAISSSHLTTRALDYNTPSQLSTPYQTYKGQLNSLRLTSNIPHK